MVILISYIAFFVLGNLVALQKLQFRVTLRKKLVDSR